jgi:hypothetical protein
LRAGGKGGVIPGAPTIGGESGLGTAIVAWLAGEGSGDAGMVRGVDPAQEAINNRDITNTTPVINVFIDLASFFPGKTAHVFLKLFHSLLYVRCPGKNITPLSNVFQAGGSFNI